MNHTATVKGGFLIRPVLFCGDITKAQETRLQALGYSVFRLPPSRHLPEAVARHPDMLFSPLPGGRLLLSRDYYEEHEKALAPYRTQLLLTEDTLERDYPSDVKFNALALNGILYGGKTLSRELMRHYGRTVTVKQGYTHCSACQVGRGIITQDPSLYKALTENGVETLLIRSGHITLNPYDTGFIGGASIPLSDTLTAFFGKIEDHPDYKAMQVFAARLGAELLSLSDEPLSDFGGGYLLPR